MNVLMGKIINIYFMKFILIIILFFIHIIYFIILINCLPILIHDNTYIKSLIYPCRDIMLYHTQNILYLRKLIIIK